ncbi:hypothetical protein FS842_001110, partial [Serendipita sp. 407]
MAICTETLAEATFSCHQMMISRHNFMSFSSILNGRVVLPTKPRNMGKLPASSTYSFNMGLAGRPWSPFSEPSSLENRSVNQTQHRCAVYIVNRSIKPVDWDKMER